MNESAFSKASPTQINATRSTGKPSISHELGFMEFPPIGSAGLPFPQRQSYLIDIDRQIDAMASTRDDTDVEDFAKPGGSSHVRPCMKSVTILFVLLTRVFLAGASAWPTKHFSDPEVIERAELIVIGHIKEGSIKKEVIEDGRAYEHHAILVVTRILKGGFEEKELPITIHYGLLPVCARDEKTMNTKPTRPEEPGQATHIFEDNPSEGYFRPTGDVHQNQIWLLHHRGYQATSRTLGVLNPEDIQPMTKEPRLEAMLHHS